MIWKFNLSEIPISLILRLVIPLLMMSFALQMGFGIGYYTLIVGVVFIVLMIISMKDKMFIREKTNIKTTANKELR